MSTQPTPEAIALIREEVEQACVRLTRVQNMGSDDGGHINNAKRLFALLLSALDAALRLKADADALRAALDAAQARVEALEQEIERLRDAEAARTRLLKDLAEFGEKTGASPWT